mmetsp:Transcript_20816/g.45135  ORF Transcript_20816/g.45135 Transcript_20816/m.45135 type:complete len:108 (+) Transcript_20816:738-1061(+)
MYSFRKNLVAKEDLTSTLCEFQASNDEMKSRERDVSVWSMKNKEDISGFVKLLDEKSPNCSTRKGVITATTTSKLKALTSIQKQKERGGDQNNCHLQQQQKNKNTKI